MSQSEYFDWLMEVGMGWLGWTEQETRDASFAALEQAFKGRVDMLKACFGSGDKPAPPVMPATTIFGAFRAAATPR